MKTVKSLVIVFIAPVILSACFASNVIKSKEMVRKPAIEVVKKYHFNASWLVLAESK